MRSHVISNQISHPSSEYHPSSGPFLEPQDISENCLQNQSNAFSDISMSAAEAIAIDERIDVSEMKLWVGPFFVREFRFDG